MSRPIVAMGAIAARRTPAAWVPTDVSGNILWLDSLSGITLGGTMRAAGTTSILLDMPVGGARGTAQFRWSFDAGANWSAATLTAATVAIDASGVTANFPVGTYNVNNTYQTTVATWADQNGGTNNVTQAVASVQPNYIYSASFGCNVVETTNGGSYRLAKTTGGLTGDATHSMWARVRPTASSVGSPGFLAIGATSTSLLLSHIGCVSGTLNFGTNTTSTPTGSSLSTGTIYSVGKTHASGGNDQGYLNGATDGSALARTYNLSAGFLVCSRSNSNGFAVGAEHRKIAMYSMDPTSGEKTSLHTWLAL